tara:strand:- start:1142 stop:1666 length:525 start_codon:yes stop_codon:yes gene_type:complete
MLDEYLTENYQKLKEIALKVSGIDEYEDLLHFVIEELYKCDPVRIREIIENNQMTFYVVRVMLNQHHSKTSRYHYKYRKYYEIHTTTTIECISPDNTKDKTKDKKLVEERLKWIEDKLKDVYWFDAEIFRIYYKGVDKNGKSFSLSQMAKETRINKNTLYKAIRNVKNYLINER